jgi:excinuclease UvrABC nuclease subunit
MRSPSEQLQLKLDNLPSSTGVYQFRNASGKIIYIGKAKNLKHRVRSYFQSPQRHDHKTQRLVSQIADVELLETRNEVESLILEANLVHEYKPRYNIALRDDKHFPYISAGAGRAAAGQGRRYLFRPLHQCQIHAQDPLAGNPTVQNPYL